MDPRLLYLRFENGTKSAWISGTVPPTASTTSTDAFVFFVSGRYVFGATHPNPVTGDYSFNVPWRGAAETQAGQLYFLRWTADAQRLPTSYEGYASKPLTVSAGGAYNGNDFSTAEITDPPEQTVSGTVDIPMGYTQTERRFWAYLGAIPIFWPESGSLGGTFNYTVPVISGVTFGVSASAEDLASRSSFFIKTGLSGNSTNVSIPLVTAPQLELPANAAADVQVTTPLTWREGGGTGVTLVEVTPGDSTGPSPTFVVVTTAAHAVIPDLSAQGMGLPPATPYRWSVDKLFPVSSVDGAADDAFLDLIGWEPIESGETLSESFAFTTKGAAAVPLPGWTVGAPATATQTARWRRVVLGAGGIPVNAR
jgi:hypothetical protein